MTDSEVRGILKDCQRFRARRKEVWEASKGVGGVVEADLKELVKLRNQAAVKLGFKNFHALQLYLNEQDGDELAQAVRRARRTDAGSRSPPPRPRSTRSWPSQLQASSSRS